MTPFGLLAWHDDPALHLKAAKTYAQPIETKATQTKAAGACRFDHEARRTAGAMNRRLRIGYLSCDFFNHATAYLIAEMIELHDRSHVEIWAYSFGPDDGKEMRKRLENGFDHFIDVKDLGTEEVAQQIYNDEIQILVDLKGYTRDSVPEILALRPAPIQVNYLGFPASMGTDFIDYILVDPYIVPEDQQPNFSERLVHLPCYQVNDRKRPIDTVLPHRTDCGLPTEGFVFCAFNATYKNYAKNFQYLDGIAR